MGRTGQDSKRGVNQKSKGGPKSSQRGRGLGNTPVTRPPPPADDPSHPTEYWKHDNKFLNRKMMIYNIISQLNADNASNSTYGEPKRTFELFDMMKEITTIYCPQQFVWPDWVDLVVELFYIIHKGNIFKYDENLSEGEFQWIKDILTKCHERILLNGSITLTADPMVPDPEEPECHPGGGGKVVDLNLWLFSCKGKMIS